MVQKIAATSNPERANSLGAMHLPLVQIFPDPTQPRKSFGNLDEMAASIRSQGIIHPLVVVPVGNDLYRIVCGECRYRAAQQLGITDVPVVVVDENYSESTLLTMQLAENKHRTNLIPLETARAYQRLTTLSSNKTKATIAAELGIQAAEFSRLLKIAQLPSAIQSEYDDLVRQGTVVEKAILLEIAKIDDEGKQRLAWEWAKAGNLTVQQARGIKKQICNKAEISATKSRSAAKRALPQTEFTMNYEITHARVTLASDAALTPDRVLKILQEVLVMATEEQKPDACLLNENKDVVPAPLRWHDCDEEEDDDLAPSNASDDWSLEDWEETV